MMLRKVYIRHRDGLPENVNMFAAYDGFRQLGVELASFEGFGDVPEIAARELSPEVGLCGYVGDVFEALRCMDVELPEPLDYPESLRPFLGREVTRSTMGEVRRGGRVFVKPIEHKLFTGLVWDPVDAAARRAVVTVPSETPVWTSEVVPIASEYRVFVLIGEIVGAKPYKGDWSMSLLRSEVERAVHTFIGAPAAYSLDFGIRQHDSSPESGRRILIEANDAFALGCYGLESTAYARMISARWEQLTSNGDLKTWE